MAIHVNIGEAKARLSQLVEAALNGQDVILQKAGVPKLKLVPIEDAEIAERQALARRRVANIGKYRDKYAAIDLTVPPSLTEAEIEERYKRKFA